MLGLLVSAGADRSPDLKAVASSEAPAPWSVGPYSVPLTHSARRAADGEAEGWRPDPEVAGDAWLRVDLAGPRGLPPGAPEVDLDWGGPAPPGAVVQWSADGAAWGEAWVAGTRYVRVLVPAAQVPAARLAGIAVRWAGSPDPPAAPQPTLSPGPDGVTIDWPDDGDPAVWAWRVLRGEGDEPVAVVPRPPVVDRHDSGGAEVRYRLVAEGADGRLGEPSAPVTARPPAGTRAFEAAGLVEGYYGPPWTWPERRAVVRALGLAGLDTYVYAPKQAPLHRDRWREPYDEAGLAALTALGAVADAAGVRFLYGIAPGLDPDHGSPQGVAALIAKCTQVLGAGAHGIVLLFDDVPTADVGVDGPKQAAVAQALADGLGPDVPLWYVPMVYSGDPRRLLAPRRAHLEALRALPDGVPVGWTGELVVPEAIGGEEIADVAELVGHPVWIWDNYPVNDSVMARYVFLAPLRGRAAGLADSAAALLANPGPLAHTSALVVVGSVSDYVHDPAGYAPENVAPVLPEALHPLEAELQAHPLIWRDVVRSALGDALDAWEASGGPREGPAAVAMARHLARLWRMPTAVDRSPVSGGLHGELAPFARAAGVVGLQGLRALGAVAGVPDEQAVTGSFWIVGGRGLDRLLPTLGRSAGEDPGWAAPPAPARVDEPWTWTPSGAPAGVTFWVEGPAGVAVDAATGAVRWTPAAVGEHRIVVGSDGPEGVRALPLEVTVAATVPPRTSPPPSSGCSVSIF